MKPCRTKVLPLVALSAFLGVGAHAQLYDINSTAGNVTSTVSDYLIPSPGGTTVNDTNWSPSSGSTATNTVYDTTDASSITLTTQVNIGEDTSSTDGTIDSDPDIYTWYALAAGFFTSTPTLATIDLSGLADNQEYELVIYTRNQSGANGRAFSISNTTAAGDKVYDENGNEEAAINMVNKDNDGFLSESDSSDAFSSSTANATVNGYETFDGNYLEIYAYSNGSGDLDLSLTNPDEGEFDISGVQVQTVPEPSTVALMALALGGVGLVAYRRRALPQC